MPKPNLMGSTRIDINGNTGWVLGANLPWICCGNDFGESAWGAFGIGSNRPCSNGALPSSQELRNAFAIMQAAKVNVARWFLFFDGHAGITYDDSGSPTGLDAVIMGDLDTALAIAKVYGIKIILVLMSFEWMYSKIEGNITGGRSNVLKSAAMRDALVNNVFVPVFQRYANDNSVFAYEVVNEPEWALVGAGLPPTAPINGRDLDPVSVDDFSRFVTQVTLTAQQYAPEQFVTLGSARAQWVRIWQNVGLDFYQFHYYPGTEGNKTLDEVLLDLPPSITRPVWLGEIPANVTGNSGFMIDTLGDAYNAGLAGGAPWSIRSVDGNGAADPVALKGFVDTHAPDINS